MVINNGLKLSGGFTLLELIVVLAGLSILSSLAIPNITRIFDFNNIDEVKSLLNTAAADCLQSARLNSGSNTQKIDPSILSNNRLNSIGYEINTSAKDCSYLELVPTNTNDALRYPIGFSITRGKVTKFATPSSSDKGSISSCESWAGGNCKQNEELKALVAYNKQISDAKQSCEDNYGNWMKSNGNGPVNRWNPTADSSCPSRPPKVVSSTCTSNGCNRKVYAVDGTVVGYTQEDYDKALIAKYGRICTEKVEALRRQSPPFTNPEGRPIQFKECGAQKFWFHKGTEVASAMEWQSLKCSDQVEANIKTVGIKKFSHCGDRTYYLCDGKDQATQIKYDICIMNNAENKCLADREAARTSGHKGKYGPLQGPGACGETRWFCDGTPHETQKLYEESKCGKASCIPRNADKCRKTGNPYWCECS